MSSFCSPDMGSFSGSYHTKQLLSNIIENSKTNKICVYILKVTKRNLSLHLVFCLMKQISFSFSFHQDYKIKIEHIQLLRQYI